jgi:hypothetical protein
MADVLVISGPAGVGKSSVAFEASRQLQVAGIEHALIDTDELDHIYPVPDDLPKVTEQNLMATWRTFSARGAQRLILVGVYLVRPSELGWIARAVPNAASPSSAWVRPRRHCETGSVSARSAAAWRLSGNGRDSRPRHWTATMG